MEGALAIAFGILVGLFVWFAITIVGQTNGSELSFKCETHGATMLYKTTNDRKYVTLHCVKNGKVVP